jgi:putative hydrolase of the HAD superfamily
MRPPLQAVLFDLDDTLHDDTHTYQRAAELVAEEVAAERGIDARALLAAYIAESDRFWKTLSSEMLGLSLSGLRVTMWTAALRAVGIDEPALAERSAVLYNEHRRGLLALWPGVLELLAGLRARGCRLGLLTNGFAETHREKIVLLQLEDVFDEVFIADEVGMVKPDPRLFRYACEKLGAAPEAAAMVGDRFDRDIRGAHAVGLYTVWMNVRHETVPLEGPEPDAIVHTVGEIEGALPLVLNGRL